MFELAQQLSYYLNVVDGGASSKLVSFGQQLASVGLIAQTARASVQSMVQPLQQVASAWSGREQQINNITRSLRQYQYVGQSIADINRDIARSMPGATEAQRGAAFTRVYNDQFQQGRNVARGLIREMNTMAAILPGEADDYMQSFSQNLPFLSQARGMTDSRAARLTSYLTAGGIAGGVDSQQSARDLMQFLTTGPHVTDRSWTEVWSQYATFHGQRVSADRIRGMNTDQRVEVLENIARQLQPMMDATGDSFEALTGTLKSLRHEVYLAVTEEVFTKIKAIMETFAKELNVAVPRLVALGRLLMGPVVSSLAWLNAKLQGFGNKLDSALQRLPDTVSRATTAFNQFTHSGPVSSIIAMGRYTGAVGHRLITGTPHGAGTDQVMGRGIVSYFREHNLSMLPAMALVMARRLGQTGMASIIGGSGAGMISGLLGTGGAGMGIIASIFRTFTGGLGTVLFMAIVKLFENGGIVSIFTAVTSAIGQILVPLGSMLGLLYQLMDWAATILADMLAAVLPPLLEATGGFVAALLGVVDFLFQLLIMIVAPFAAVFVVAIYGAMAAFYVLAEVLAVIGRIFGAVFGSSIETGASFTAMLRELTNEMSGMFRELRESIDYLLMHIGWLSNDEYQARTRAVNNIDSSGITAALRRAMSMINNDFDIEERRGRAPPNRPQVHQDFRYSRFDITQKFADGFSPERVAAALVGDLESMANQRLSSGLVPAFSNGG